MAKSQSTQRSNTGGTVKAEPTKSFFVSMLTRDIELIDAIMDLIDNCIDGVHRKNKGSRKKESNISYNGYHADIRISEKEFRISDNCGGIPLTVAKEYAFKMGRSDAYHGDENLETLGMYGIGMKRAIFKMGLSAEIISWNGSDRFQVSIPNDWTKFAGWTFNYAELKSSDVKKVLSKEGTVVQISNIHKNIARQFKDESGFLKNLRTTLKSHYGYIIQQGFTIRVNNIKIEPLELNIYTFEGSKSKKTIKPFVYSTKVDDVEIEIIIGFYRPLATDDEMRDELEGAYARAQSDTAGITVLCNDRVVLYCDKTFLTGWGEPPVPKYHTQFIAIAGAVHFKSSKPINLPVTTTKRGLDTSSPIYAAAKIKIKEGLRYFTSFTNEWKFNTEERRELFKGPKHINALSPGQSKSPLVTLKTAKKGDAGSSQIPDLPKPDDAEQFKFITIAFQKEKQKVAEMKEYYFEGQNKSAAEVGAWCFDKMFARIEK